MTYATKEEKEKTLLPHNTEPTEIPSVPTAQPAAEESATPAANATNAPAVEEPATTQPAQPQPTTAPPATQQLSRQAVSGYGDVAPYLAPLRAAQRDPGAYLEKIDEIDRQLPRAVEEYRRTGRNPLADIVLASQKPRRRVDEERRLKTQAVLQSFNNLFSLLGKGIAASAGLRPTPVDNKPIEEIHRRLQQLDDLYRNEKQRYDQNELLAAIRKDQTNLQAAKAEADALSARRKGYIDLYKGDLEHNRQLTEKAAELGVKSSQYRSDLQYKYDKMKSDEETANKNRAVQWARLAKEHPQIKIRNYSTGGYDDLTPERWADIAGVIDLITDQRESAKKGPYGEWMAGKTPNWMNNELTDEELADLRGALKNGKLTVTQEGLVSRLYNRMVSGGFYDPDAEHPYGVAPKPTSGYAQINHKQYVNYVRGMHDWMQRTKQIKGNTITIKEARDVFGMPEPTPEASVRRVVEDAGLIVVK
ncbi:MAG: hypothetical protein K2G93_03120 [Rikenella sp.]|nr:hypothetical protein [Rikenella sp.]